MTEMSSKANSGECDPQMNYGQLWLLHRLWQIKLFFGFLVKVMFPSGKVGPGKKLIPEKVGS